MVLQVGQILGSTAAGLAGSTGTFNNPAGSPITVSAASTNVSSVFLGGSTTVSSTDGFALSPGMSVSLRVTNLSDIYVRLITAGDQVTWMLD